MRSEPSSPGAGTDWDEPTEGPTMGKQRIKRGVKVGLELSPAERKLLLTGLVFRHEDVEAAIRSTPPGGEVMLTLGDLEDLVGHVAGEANHAKSERTDVHGGGAY